MNTEPASSPGRFPAILRKADQACCALLLVVALLAVGVCWVYQGGLSGRLVDVDRAEKRSIQFQLDMNRADWPEWSLLPGVGETLAKRIVNSRVKDGPFRGPEDLLRVHGIGPKTLDRMRPYLLPTDHGRNTRSR